MSLYPTLNRRPLDTLLYQLCEVAGHLDPTVPTRAVLDRVGAAPVLGPTVTVTPREIRLGCDVRAVNLADRQTLMDRIKRRLGGVLELRTADLPGRYLRCEYIACTVEHYPGDYATVAVYITLVLRAVDPARWEDEPLVYGVSTTARTACPIGTESSAPDVWLYGACTDPEIIVRNAQGTEVSRTRFTGSLGANDALWVCGGQFGGLPGTMTRLTAGVASNALALYRDGALPLFAPGDDTLDGTVSPTVELAAASGTPTGLIRYVRRW